MQLDDAIDFPSSVIIKHDHTNYIVCLTFDTKCKHPGHAIKCFNEKDQKSTNNQSSKEATLQIDSDENYSGENLIQRIRGCYLM